MEDSVGCWQTFPDCYRHCRILGSHSVTGSHSASSPWDRLCSGYRSPCTAPAPSPAPGDVSSGLVWLGSSEMDNEFAVLAILGMVMSRSWLQYLQAHSSPRSRPAEVSSLVADAERKPECPRWNCHWRDTLLTGSPTRTSQTKEPARGTGDACRKYGLLNLSLTGRCLQISSLITY